MSVCICEVYHLPRILFNEFSEEYYLPSKVLKASVMTYYQIISNKWELDNIYIFYLLRERKSHYSLLQSPNAWSTASVDGVETEGKDLNSVWLAGTQRLELSLLIPNVCISRNLKSGVGASDWTQVLQCVFSTCILTSRPNAQSKLYFMYSFIHLANIVQIFSNWLQCSMN